MTSLTLALSKGRILEDSAPLLARLGLAPAEGLDDRLLRLPSRDKTVQLLIIRPSDVPTYVEHGAADFGIVGKDVLMEHGSDDLYEPLDLGLAKCRLSVAAPKNRSAQPSTAMDGGSAARDRMSERPFQRLRVATKYPDITRRHFAAKGQQVEIIKLYGSMELAPLVGLADCIVDLINTGSTLRANGLVETETIAAISARLVVNKAAMKMKHAAVRGWLDRFRSAIGDA